jgi:uncharacterized protein involved in exopolysaccharide biosynthesis
MENKDKETISLKSVIVRYLHRWKLFLAVFLFSFIPAVLYIAIYPKTYEFAASIQLQEEKESSMATMGLGEAAGLMKSFGIGTGGGGVDMDDEIAILTSNRMLRLMIYDLGVYVSYSKPYSLYKMYNEAPLKLTVDSVTMADLNDQYNFTVSVSPENVKVNVKSLLSGYKETVTCTHLPVTFKLGADEFRLDYDDHNGASEKNFTLKITCTPLSWMAEKLGEDMLVEGISTSSKILELTCSDHSMERGKDMLNMLIRKYNEDAETFESIRDRKTMKLVDERIAKVIADLGQVELDIQAYKTKNEMTLLESDVLLYGETMKDVRTAIMEVESQTYLINMLDEYVKDPANKYSVVPSLMTTEGEQGGAITVYNAAIVERDRILKNSNEKNPMFKIVDNQVETLRAGVFVMIENARKTSEKTLEGLKSKENELLSKMRTIPAKEREYVNYRRNQEILQGLYLMLLQKREETNLSLENRTERARVIDPAYIKKKPLGPRKLYAAIGMLILTLVIPIGYLLAKDIFVSIKEEYKRTK